jgi:hypothetical protein
MRGSSRCNQCKKYCRGFVGDGGVAYSDDSLGNVCPHRVCRARFLDRSRVSFLRYVANYGSLRRSHAHSERGRGRRAHGYGLVAQFGGRSGASTKLYAGCGERGFLAWIRASLTGVHHLLHAYCPQQQQLLSWFHLVPQAHERKTPHISARARWNSVSVL